MTLIIDMKWTKDIKSLIIKSFNFLVTIRRMQFILMLNKSIKLFAIKLKEIIMYKKNEIKVIMIAKGAY